MITQEIKTINDLVQEVNYLKRRIEELGHGKQVSVYGKSAPIFGPENGHTYESPWSEDYKGPNGFFNDPNRPFP